MEEGLESIQILEKLKASGGQDPTVVAATYDRYFRRMLGLIRKRLGSQFSQYADEDDLAQSAFGSFVKGVGQGKFELDDRESLWPLLALMATRKYQDLVARYRTQSRDHARVQAADGFELARDHQRPALPDEAIAVEETIRLVQERLPEHKHQEVLRLLLEERSVEEIADQLGLSDRTVKRVLHRIRELWREIDDSIEC